MELAANHYVRPTRLLIEMERPAINACHTLDHNQEVTDVPQTTALTVSPNMTEHAHQVHNITPTLKSKISKRVLNQLCKTNRVEMSQC
jgi:hypothetical protein